MIKIFAGLILSLVLGSCATTGGQKDLKVDYDEFQKILTPRSMVLLEGENAMLVTMARAGDDHPKVYRYDFETKDFAMVYDHGQSVGRLTESRTGKNIFLHIDNKGDENSKIYTFDKKTNKPTLLFGNDDREAYVLNTDQNDEYLFFASNHENKAVYSIYRMKMASKKVTRLSDGRMNLRGGMVTPDGTFVVAIRPLSNNENQLYLINTKTKSTKLFFKKSNSIFRPAFMHGSTASLYGTTDYKRDRLGCARIPLNKPNHVYYVKEKKGKDVSCGYGEWSKLYYLTTSYKGRSELTFYRSMFKNKVDVPQLFNNQTVRPVAYDRTTGDMLLKYSAANNPGSLTKFNIKSKKYAEVLDYNRSSIGKEELATSYDFEYKSFDGLPIHGILYAKPEWKTSGKKYPLVIWPHGGPDSHESHNYRKWFQFMALNDFVIYAPNFRGSTGYGKKFETLNDKDWGGGHIKDLVEARKAVEKLPWIDEKNTFIFGGSFGGYSTLAAVTFHPDAFDAAVGVVALGNLFTFMKSIPPDEAWQTEFKREVGDPVKDKKLYEERSPFFHVNNIKVPLQIYQAENDIRTVKPEMDAFVAEMEKQGKPVEYTVLKDVGHGLARPEAQKKIAEGTVRFFRSKIKK
jgi:dipeptidyl aminopeptidase/acylaminoacyl peptidase